MAYTQREYVQRYDRPLMAMLHPRLWKGMFSKLRELHIRISKRRPEFRLTAKTASGRRLVVQGGYKALSQQEAVPALRLAVNRAVVAMMKGAV